MATENETVIGANTHVVGEVRGEASLTVRGRVEGRIEISEALVIDAGGIVKADVEVRSAVVAGVLVGSVVASESVRLLPKARVVGNISAPRVAIEAGAAYRGRLEMGPVDLSQRQGARATARAAASATTGAAAAKAPPRLSRPIKGTAVASPTTRRVVSVPVRKAAKAASPGWARKKVKRR